MKLLFIGGTGLISSACAELAAERGHELFILTRGLSPKYATPQRARALIGDVSAGVGVISPLVDGLRFDAVVDFVAFTPEDVERDIALWRGKTAQFVFISSASAYQKPPAQYLITENTPLENPYWEYSRGKIACEQTLVQAHLDGALPVTIVRPSLTYGPSQIPLCVGSWAHPWTMIDRIKHGKPVIVPGDGTSLWVLTWNGDFAKGLVGLLGNPKAIGEVFHITSDEVLTWNQIYREVFEALGVPPTIVHVPSELIAKYWAHAYGSLMGDKMHSAVFDNDKIRRAVPDFRCEVDWPEGLRRAIRWHEARPQFQTIDEEFNVTLDRIVQAYGKALPSE